MNAFEWGTGGSTLFLGERCQTVRSIEGDSVWSERVSAELGRRSLDNVRVELHPVLRAKPSDFRDSSYLAAIRGSQYDLIVIDGPEDADGDLRPLLFEEAERVVAKGGLIVMDDFWRYPQLANDHCAARMEFCTSVGPCRWGVTSTAVFFYGDATGGA